MGAEDGRDPEIADERLGMGDAFALRQQRDRRRAAIDLRAVEHREGPGENAAGRRVVVIAAVIIARRHLLPEHDGRAALALADLGVEGLPLAIGAPNPVPIAGCLRCDPKRDHVDATIMVTGNIGRACDVEPAWCQGIFNAPAPASTAATISAVIRE